MRAASGVTAQLVPDFDERPILAVAQFDHPAIVVRKSRDGLSDPGGVFASRRVCPGGRFRVDQAREGLRPDRHFPAGPSLGLPEALCDITNIVKQNPLEPRAQVPSGLPAE